MIRLPATYIDKHGSKQLPLPGLRRLQPLLERLGRRVIVLGRAATYFVEDDVALQHARDIRAYLRSNASVLCPFSGWQALFVVSERKPSHAQAKARTRLAIWFYDPALIESVAGQKTALVIPEDLAIARQSQSRVLYQVGGLGRQGYCLYASGGRLLNSRLLNEDVLASGDGSAVEADIRELSGVSPMTLTESERELAVQRGLAALDLKDLTGLLKLPTRGLSMSGAGFKPWLIAGAALAGLWLAGTSAVIQFQHEQIQQAKEGLSGDLKTVLLANRTEQELRQRLEFLWPLVNGYPQVSNVFTALSRLGMENITVSRIGFIGTQLLITGEAPSASALLADASALPWVKDARFNAPVARRNGVARFTLVLELNTEALFGDAST